MPLFQDGGLERGEFIAIDWGRGEEKNVKMRVPPVGPVGDFKGPDFTSNAKFRFHPLPRLTVEQTPAGIIDSVQDEGKGLVGVVRDRQSQEKDAAALIFPLAEGLNQFDPPLFGDLRGADRADPDGAAGHQVPVMVGLAGSRAVDVDRGSFRTGAPEAEGNTFPLQNRSGRRLKCPALQTVGRGGGGGLRNFVSIPRGGCRPVGRWGRYPTAERWSTGPACTDSIDVFVVYW